MAPQSTAAAVADPPAAVAVVARRPVLDRRLRTVGFELVFREGPLGSRAFGGELGSSGHPSYLRVTRDFLTADGADTLDPAAVVLELDAGLAVDDDVVRRIRALRARGFGVVLDNFSSRSEHDRLLHLVDTVKLDVVALGHHAALSELERLHRRSLEVLADGVDSEDVFDVFREAGCDLFQGLFYERPKLSPGGALPGGQAIGALAELQRGADFESLEDIIRRDAGLSYRLLRQVNSAFYSLPRTVSSVREALVILGTRAVRQWAVALVLSGIEDRPHALLSTALVRARTCELVLTPYDRTVAEHGFTAGLFSLLDALLGAPMEEVLAELPLGSEIVRAITEHDGIAGKALEKTIAYERGNFEAPALAGHARAAMAIAYADAVRWADAVL